jgi:predicted NBD/HSP70 family sugar kinase
MKRETVLAFDIGGTKTASALVGIQGEKYEVTGYKKDSTPLDRLDLVDKILKEIESRKKDAVISRIAIAVAGQIDTKGEKIISSPNIPELNNFALGKFIARKAGLPVALINDVRAFAYGEDRFGKYKGYDNMLFIAPGTGIGGAAKINGRFYFGKDNIAGEFGHMVIVKDGKDCPCGRQGCWERYFSGPAIEQMYEETYKRKKASRDIVKGALSGSVDDRRLLLEAGTYFVTGFSNLVNIFDPEIVILGGSVFKEKGLLRFLAPSLKSEVLPSARKVKVVNSSLGDEAFLLGAAIGK